MKTLNTRFYVIPFLLVIFLLFGCSQQTDTQTSANAGLYRLDTGQESRSISFENQTGEKSAGGKAANYLGVGRKGFPAKTIEAGETVVLCDITGPGCIRHIWMTGGFKDNTTALRGMVVRAYWDGQETPSIECPLGDFMGFAHAKVVSYQSAVHSVGSNAALNLWLPMPFDSKCKITLTNECDKGVTLFYQIDYTTGDKHPADFGRLHVSFRRENPTTIKKDFEILPKRTGKGRFIGAVIGIRTLSGNWWGEGEIKIYKDGDTDFPTICGTGSEDYVCLSYGIQQTQFLYHGCCLDQNGFISMYRWHLQDPIYWNKECRMTIQQIGWSPDLPDNPDEHLFERQDDWCAAAFWYEPVPSAPLPELPSLKQRTADLFN